ncbi:hemerythrin domain-containing protein [Kitasatospora sp. NPDC058406]|uniref:hemerythrin domain-containing protein n=1 Tax=Kitasatospora sp. NPDC058406 TaxID=3346483 RepID=UPI0036658FDE
MSRRPDILDEFTAEHRAVEELLARIEAAGPGQPSEPSPTPATTPATTGTAGATDETGAARAPAEAPEAAPGSGSAGSAAPPGLPDEPVGLLTDLLFSHCAAEEEHLFPVVQHDVPDGGALVFQCIHDHLAIGQYLADLQALPPGDPTSGTLLNGLTELLRRHLATEERQLYPAARKALPPGARAALAERLRATREEVARNLGGASPDGVSASG